MNRQRQSGIPSAHKGQSEMWLQVQAHLHPAGFLQAEPEYDSELNWVLASNNITVLIENSGDPQ